jgi:phospholipase C
MALCGCSSINDTFSKQLPDQTTLFDFLTANAVRWRLYHDGALPFIALMPKYIGPLATGNGFRSFDQFAYDWHNESAVTFPSVFWIDPAFADAHAPHPNDDHPPVSVWEGQRLLKHVYEVLLTRPDRWQRTLMVVVYDEHGAFFDHVSPPRIQTPPPPGFHYATFDSLGVRVPAFVVSPLVEPGALTRPGAGQPAFDHLSILKLVVEKWDKGQCPDFSSLVKARPVGSLSEFITRTQPRSDTPAIAWGTPTSPNSAAFVGAANAVVNAGGIEAVTSNPKLWHVG